MELIQAPAVIFLETFAPLLRRALANVDVPGFRDYAEMKPELKSEDHLIVDLRLVAKDGPDFRFACFELKGLFTPELQITLVHDNTVHAKAIVFKEKMRVRVSPNAALSAAEEDRAASVGAAQECARLAAGWLLQEVIPNAEELKAKIGIPELATA